LVDLGLMLQTGLTGVVTRVADQIFPPDQLEQLVVR
jgi:hypothetical protein